MGRGWGEDGEERDEAARRIPPRCCDLGPTSGVSRIAQRDCNAAQGDDEDEDGERFKGDPLRLGKKTRPLDGPIGTVCLFFGGAVQSGNPRSRFETSRRRRSRAFTAQDLGRRSIPVRLLAGKTPLQIQSGEQAKAVFLGLAAGVAQRRLPRGCEMAAAAGLGEVLLEASRAARGGDLCGHRNSFCVFA